MDADREIRILLAERAIEAVMNRYCQALDSARAADWLDCFTSDAIFEVLRPNGATSSTMRMLGPLFHSTASI